MDNETTQEVPLPPGTRPNPNTVDTQEILVISTLELPVVPEHLLNDPIMTMDAPQPDERLIFERWYGPSPKRPEPVREGMALGDRILVGMGSAVVMGAAGMFLMLNQGWLAQMPEEPSEITLQMPSRSPERTLTPTRTPESRRTPVEAREEPVVSVAGPETFTPQPTKSIVVITPTPEPTPEPASPTPTPTEEESLPVIQSSRPAPPPPLFPDEPEPEQSESSSAAPVEEQPTEEPT